MLQVRLHSPYRYTGRRTAGYYSNSDGCSGQYGSCKCCTEYHDRYAGTATPAAPTYADGRAGGLTNDATPDIKGTAEAGSTVTIYVDGASVGTTTADGAGNYTYTLPSGQMVLIRWGYSD
ncbi:Ig-like domain-containing protein [Chitinophaga pinensis]|uniref:Ig-like domain-containing protein n=1 Tax=Chitinophaga pinensis TaxID=79329 RepID=UPI00396562FD